MHQELIKKAGVAAVTAIGAIAFAAPSAPASTVTVTGGDTVRVAESGNEGNQITVSYDAGADLYRVTDAASTLSRSMRPRSRRRSRRTSTPPTGTTTSGERIRRAR